MPYPPVRLAIDLFGASECEAMQHVKRREKLKAYDQHSGHVESLDRLNCLTDLLGREAWIICPLFMNFGRVKPVIHTEFVANLRHRI